MAETPALLPDRSRLKMHKLGKDSGYDGAWQVDYFEMDLAIGPAPVIPPVHTSQRQDFGAGWMDCLTDMAGTRLRSVCSGGNLTWDVSQGKIGSKQTGVWVGKLSGRQVEIRWPAPAGILNLTGEVRENPLCAADWCKEATKMPFFRNATAGVICIAGTAMPCVWQPSAVPEINECMLEHERFHVGESVCPREAGPNTSMSPKEPAPAKPTGFDECTAYRKELRCLQQARSICSKPGVITESCVKDFDFYIGNAMKQIERNRCH